MEKLVQRGEFQKLHAGSTPFESSARKVKLPKQGLLLPFRIASGKFKAFQNDQRSSFPV